MWRWADADVCDGCPVSIACASSTISYSINTNRIIQISSLVPLLLLPPHRRQFPHESFPFLWILLLALPTFPWSSTPRTDRNSLDFSATTFPPLLALSMDSFSLREERNKRVTALIMSYSSGKRVTLPIFLEYGSLASTEQSCVVFLKDIASGKSILFAPRLPADYAVWLGKIKPLSYFKERYKVNEVFYTDEIVRVLHEHYKGSGKPLLFLLHGLNTDSNNFSKPAELEEMEKFDTDLSTLHPILTECRILKSDLELALIQYANDISSEAHIEVMRKIKVGMKEYQLESMFLHHVYMYGGCRHCSYTCICATGENSAVLHYGHAAAPNDRTLEDGDMALLDMGAEYHFYGSDITCSFPVNGKFTMDQSLIYNAVLKAHNAVISTMKPGISWIDMHKLAEKTILECLKTGGILTGDLDDMMAGRLGAVFMPHGLGHFLGIDTHDPGGYTKEMERPKEAGLKSLRTIRELQEGMVITVEPGCYFIDALLNPAIENSNTSRFINHQEICRFRNFGGVRIESDVHVTSNGCENLTKCPREVSEIEAVMAGVPWPPAERAG